MTDETAKCEECGAPATYRLGTPTPAWCALHGPHGVTVKTALDEQANEFADELRAKGWPEAADLVTLHYWGIENDAAPTPLHLIEDRDVLTERLEAMESGRSVIDSDGDVWQRRGNLWCSYETSEHTSRRLSKFAPLHELRQV